MKLIGHNTKYRGWTIYLHERLGDVTGQAARAEPCAIDQDRPIVHRTVIFEKDSISDGCSIAHAAKNILINVKENVDKLEAQLAEAKLAPLKKLMKPKKKP